MVKRYDGARELGTHDQGAEHRHLLPSRDTRYAAIGFENLVQKAVADGVITRDEAIYLSMEHVRLQEKSREALRNLLKTHGFKEVVFNGDPDTPMASRVGIFKDERRLPLPQTTDHKSRARRLFGSDPRREIQRASVAADKYAEWRDEFGKLEPDVDTHVRGINLARDFMLFGDAILGKRRIPQKVTWLSIVGAAAFAALLGVLGVI